MSTENEKTEKKELNFWVKEIIHAVITGIGFGIVLIILKRMGWI